MRSLFPVAVLAELHLPASSPEPCEFALDDEAVRALVVTGRQAAALLGGRLTYLDLKGRPQDNCFEEKEEEEEEVADGGVWLRGCVHAYVGQMATLVVTV